MSKGDFPDGGDLGGEGQDVCSFFAGLINQRQSVERLLNWLRESQTTCTDTNCFDHPSGLLGTEHGTPTLNDNLDSHTSADQEPVYLVFWFIIALFTLFAITTSRSRQAAARKGKPSNSTGNGPSRPHDDDDQRPNLL